MTTVKNKQYSLENVNQFEFAFGEGFMTCGGANYLMKLFDNEDLTANQKILDIGCGLGGSAFFLENRFDMKVIGVDIEEMLISQAQQTALNKKSQCQFICSDILTMEFDHNSFDYILSRDSFLHFDQNQKNILMSKILSWLKPGGKLLCTDYGISEKPLDAEQLGRINERSYHLLMQSEYYDVLEQHQFIRINVEDDTNTYGEYTQSELDGLQRQKDLFIQQYSLQEFNLLVETFKNKLKDIHDGVKRYWLISAEKFSLKSQRLKDKVVICTGASSGIGRATAIALASHGATLVLAARNVEKLNAIKNLIDTEDIKALVVQTDVSIQTQTTHLLTDTMNTYGRVDILINAAGVMFYTFMENGFYEDWEKTIDVNIKGVVNCVGSTIPILAQQRKGHIINISSDTAVKNYSGLAVYSASKAFVSTFSKHLQSELRGKGIKISDIQPGDVRTDLINNNRDTQALEALGLNPNYKVGHGWATDSQVLDPFDVADVILGIVETKKNVGIHEVLIEPRDQEWASL